MMAQQTADDLDRAAQPSPTGPAGEGRLYQAVLGELLAGPGMTALMQALDEGSVRGQGHNKATELSAKQKSAKDKADKELRDVFAGLAKEMWSEPLRKFEELRNVKQKWNGTLGSRAWDGPRVPGGVPELRS
eukprot:g22742.t1